MQQMRFSGLMQFGARAPLFKAAAGLPMQWSLGMQIPFSGRDGNEKADMEDDVAYHVRFSDGQSDS
jgi:hypothetical protein